MLLFIDGGILNGTPNKVNIQKYMNFLNGVDISYVISGTLPLIICFSYMTYKFANKRIRIYKLK